MGLEKYETVFSKKIINSDSKNPPPLHFLFGKQGNIFMINDL